MASKAARSLRRATCPEGGESLLAPGSHDVCLAENAPSGAASAAAPASGGGGGDASSTSPCTIAAPAAATCESPEEACGFLGRLCFVWAFRVMWGGYMRGRINLEDLPPLPSFDQPDRLCRLICDDLRPWVARSSGGGAIPRLTPKRLALSLARISYPLLLPGIGYRFTCTLAQCVQPMLLHQLLSGMATGKSSGAVAFDGLGIAAAVMVQWVCAEYAWIQYIKCDFRMQAALIHLVYRKAVYLPATIAGFTIGELQNLFSTDATKATGTFIHNQLWVPLESSVILTVAMWNLTSLIGSAGFVTLATIIAFLPFTFLVSRYLTKTTKHISRARDGRGRLFNQFLSAMRVVKCFKLEAVAWEQISAAREEELSWLRRRFTVGPVNSFLNASASGFATAAGFMWFVLVLDKKLTPAAAFAVLAWSDMIKSSLTNLPNVTVGITDNFVSLCRLARLLNAEAEEQWLDALPDAVILPAGSSTGVEAVKQGVQDGDQIDFRLSCCDIGYPVGGGLHRGIQGLSLRVEAGELLMVCGPIGCGKTTLLQALAGVQRPLLGDCIAREGRSTAFAAQRPWLLNASLLDNITFGRPLEPEWLSNVLAACALEPDLKVLPQGLETLVGEEGVQLSGGQKQRVSLARAVYSRSDVVLLDDIMSALDAHVGQHIWNAVVCGLLAGRTRVLVTHQTQYCSHPAVTRILLLSESGGPTHLGTFRDVCRSGGDHLLGALETNHGGKDGEEDGEAQGEGEGSKNDGNKGEDSTASSVSLNMAETRQLGAVRWRDFTDYLAACGGIVPVGAVTLLLVAYYGSIFATRSALATWTNAGEASELGRQETIEFNELFLGLTLLTGLGSFAFFMGLQLVSLRASGAVHRRFAHHLLRAEMRFFDTTPTGRALNRCLKDMQMIDERMSGAFRELFESMMNCVVSVGNLLFFAWPALFALPIFGIIYWRVTEVYRWPARDLKRLEGMSRSPMMAHFADSIRGAGTIRAYRHDQRFIRHNLELMGDIQRTGYWFWSAQGWVSTLQEVLGTFLLAGICCVIAWRASVGALSPGYAGLALTYAISMPRDLMWLSRRVASFEVEFVSVERVLEYARLPLEEDEQARRWSETRTPSAARAAAAEPAADAAAKAAGSVRYAICAESLWFQYAVDLPWVLQDLSLRIPLGSRAALVGRTGSGKSSILSVLSRLYPPAQGCVSVLGQDIMETPLAVLRSQVRVLLQDPIFFSGTVRSNLLCRVPKALPTFSSAAVGSAEEDALLWRALQQSGLEELVRALPQGLDEPVQEGGNNFSQGERQLLCLARVLVPSDDDREGGGGAARVLLCDEPTSACDLATDELIHGTLLHGLPDAWTLVVVCHRLHRIREFDSVYVLDAGRLLEEGKPALLLGGDSVGVPTGTAGGNSVMNPGAALASLCHQQGVC